jgi:uncharacterized membrane protein required for colicin V production
MVVVVFVIIVFTSYRKGFIRSVIELAGYLASFVVSYIFSAPFGKWIFSTFLQPVVSGQIKDYIVSNIASKATAQANGALDSSGIASFANNIPGAFKSMLGNYNISTDTLHIIAGSAIKSSSQSAADVLITNVINPITQIISRGIAFAIIFALCMIAVQIIASLSNGVSKIPIIGSVNRIGGAVVGVLKSVIVLLIIATCIAVIIPVLSLQKNPVITQANVSNSTIFKAIYNNNPLTQMLLKK